MRERISTDNAAKLIELTRVRTGWITQVQWSPDGTTLAIAGADGLRLYAGTFGGEPTHALVGHTGHVKGVAFHPDNQIVATVSADTTLKLWDISNIHVAVTEIATLDDHQDSVDCVAFSDDGTLIATGCADGMVYLWNTETHELISTLEGHEKEVSGLDFALRGKLLVSGGRDNTLRLWDTTVETGGTLLGRHDDWIRFVVSNPPGTMVASASKDMTVRLWDTFSGDLYAIIMAHPEGVDALAFSPYGELLATGGRDNIIRIWNVQRVLNDGKADASNALVALEGHDKPVLSLDFNRPGTLLVSGSGDNTARLWSVGAE